MGSTRLTGNTYGDLRPSGVEVCHTYPVNFNTVGIASAILVDTIHATADNPVHVEVSACVVTAFNAGTTNVLTAGTSSTATEWLGSADITEGTPGYYPASNAVFKARLVADTAIYVKYAQTGTAATTGAATIIVKEFSENTKAIA